jgi:hypothetical protein
LRGEADAAHHSAVISHARASGVVKPTQQRSDELTGVFMFVFINAFLIGTASGLRALIGLAAVSWAVHSGILPLDHTWLAFLGYAWELQLLAENKQPGFGVREISSPGRR